MPFQRFSLKNTFIQLHVRPALLSFENSFQVQKNIVCNSLCKKSEIPPKFYHSKQGKPMCNVTSYSVSHDGDYYVVAVTENSSVLNIGVDIVDCRRHINLSDFSPFFTAQELSFNNTREFFKMWARKEAEAKVSGEGIWLKLGSEKRVDKENVHTVFFEIDENHICAVAVA